MPDSTFRGRRAVEIQNRELRVTILPGGGHIAAITDLASGVSPLWEPKWRSVDPSAFDAASYPEFGTGSDARLLAGIAGHNLCLDLFGGSSEEEFRAGLTPHGEGSVVDFDVAVEAGELVQRSEMPLAKIRFSRRVGLEGRMVRIRETVESVAAFDRPIAWTQHVTLGEPFLEPGQTQFRASATKSKVYEDAFGAADYLTAGAEFDWPLAPRTAGGLCDLQVYNDSSKSGAFTTHLMDRSREDAFFTAFSPRLGLLFGYVWKRRDFPWLGIWEENRSRMFGPWEGKEVTRGMEFGVSPMPESRRQMVDRGTLFGEPAYRWLPAGGRLEAEYFAVLRPASEIEAIDIFPVDR